ncbi:MAG: hypothetical protein RIQ52_1095, partial [Pseudomonadota bacterium]
MSIRPSPISRRQFIRSTAAGVLASTLIPGHLLAMEGMSMTPMPKLPPNRANPQFRPDVEVEMLCVRKAIPILSGAPTQVMMYQGRVLSGPEDALVPMPHGYLGPLLRLQKGQKVRVHLRNALGEPTITHWHGLHVPPEMDGHPMYAIDDGETFVYEFEVKNRACF